MTSQAKVLYVCLCEDNLPVLCGGVAGATTVLIGKWRMQKLRHELGLCRLMGIVALQAVGLAKRLVLMRLLQRGIFRVMTVCAERGRGFGQVKTIFNRRVCASFMSHMAGVASHVERSVTAAFFRNVEALRVTTQAEVIFLLSRGRLQELILVLGCMGIMALETVANRRGMDGTLGLGCILVRVASETETIRSCSCQLDARDILINPYLVTRETAHRDGGVHSFALGFVFVTLQACRRICFCVEWYGMHRGGTSSHRQRHHSEQNKSGSNEMNDSTVMVALRPPTEPHATGEKSHTASN